MSHNIQQYSVVVQSNNDAKRILLDIEANLSKIINEQEKDPNILQLEGESLTLTISERLGWICVLTLFNIEEGCQLILSLSHHHGKDTYCIKAPRLGVDDINGAEGLILVYRFFLAILYHEINRFGSFQVILEHPDIIKLILDMSKSIKAQFEDFDELEKFNQDYTYRESIRDAFYVLYNNNSCYILPPPPPSPPQSQIYYLECHSSEMEEILDYIEKNQYHLEDVD